jgi:carboxylesterase type B
VAACSLLFLLPFVGQSTAKQVTTIYGAVDGNTVTLDDGSIIHSWYGIPYAKPPIGELRFERPQLPVSWTGVRETKELPDACIQDPAGLIWMTHPGWHNYSEDCLNLNVYAPDDLSESPLAVMVWFHGGGYVGGGNVQYPGHFLAARGVVVVVPNYRLDSFGFLATPDGTLTGNMGMFDQTMSLLWVRNNIAAFGGDPNRVTIFGQSAGGGSSSLHMISPYSTGLYAQAILESGTENNVWSLNYPGQVPETYVYQLAERVNCTRSTDAEMVACLKEKPAVAIRLGQSIECTPGYFCQGYAPIVDGDGGFVPDVPLKLREEAHDDSYVPIISGICRDDGSLYTSYFIPEANDGGFTNEEFEYYMKNNILDIFAAQMTQEQYDNVYEALQWYYQEWPYLDDLDYNREAFNKMITDGAFGYAWDRQLKMNTQHNAPTYAYVQSFISNNASSFIPPWMGVPHMGELPYVWGYGKLLNNPEVREDSGIFYDIVGWTDEDITYADYQITLWTNFAKYGNPTPEPVKSPFDETMTTWEEFKLDDGLKVFDLDYTITTHENFRQQRDYFFLDFISYLADKEVRRSPDEVVKRQATGRRGFNSDKIKEAQKKMILNALAASGLVLEDPDLYEEQL